MNYLEIAKGVEPRILTWYHDLHQCPEVGRSLPQTRTYVCKCLEEMGIPHETFKDHSGIVAVCNAKGELVAWAGEPDTVTYMRSAAKPIQALNIFLSGAQERYQFDQKELSIACASHYGEEFHQKTILGMLEKLGLDLSDLLCGNTYSISEEVKNKQLREHFKLDNYNSDCSGKHCGFLAACLVRGYSIKGYNSPDHPLQKDILQVMSEVCQVPAEEIPIGVDGCSVPVHALPVKNMAIGFAREANPEYLPEKYREGAGKLYDAMNAHPEMVAGTHGFCTELMEKTHGKLFGKLGAEGVYCIGIRDKNLGIAVKNFYSLLDTGRPYLSP